MKQDIERQMLGEFKRMRDEMDRLMEGMLPGRRLPPRHQCVWCPPTDVYETDEAAIVKVEIAGVEAGDFQISFADNVLTVAGVRQAKESCQRAYQQMEIWSGPFRTQVNIPWRVDSAAIEAEYDAGFLVVRLPKVQPQTKRVPIKSSEE